MKKKETKKWKVKISPDVQKKIDELPEPVRKQFYEVVEKLANSKDPSKMGTKIGKDIYSVEINNSKKEKRLFNDD